MSAPAPKPKPSLFSEAEADEPTEPVSVAYNVEASKAMRKKMEAEKQVDSTVYEYDEVWDRMQAEKERQKALKNAEAQERKVRYLCLLRPSLLLISYRDYLVFSRST